MYTICTVAHQPRAGCIRLVPLRLIIPVVQEVGATDPVGQNSPNPHCTGWLELDPSKQNQPAVQRSVGAERPVVSQ